MEAAPRRRLPHHHKDESIKMKESDLKIESVSPYPKGGQQAGLPPMGVKVTHIPTGLEAYSIYHRSQYRNKKIAMAMIEYGLAEINYRDID